MQTKPVSTGCLGEPWMCGETIGNRDLRERAALPDLDAACAAAGITDGGRCRDRCDLLSIIGPRHALRTEIQMDLFFFEGRDPDGSGAACVPSRPRRSTHARPRDTHGAPRGGGRRGRRRVRTIVVEDTERPPRVLIRVRHKLSETPKLCCARLIDRSCRAHANRVCVA